MHDLYAVIHQGHVEYFTGQFLDSVLTALLY